jgi:hypothetical protein
MCYCNALPLAQSLTDEPTCQKPFARLVGMVRIRKYGLALVRPK